jgi:hypothetical protein
VAVASRARPKSRVEAVDATRHSLASLDASFVAHGIGEDLHRVGAPYGIAVEVEQLVHLGERQRAVATEQRQTGGTQRPTVEPPRWCCRGRQGGLVMIGRSATAVAGEDRPQAVAELIELAQGEASLLEPVGDCSVALVEIEQELVALLVEPYPDRVVESGCLTALA